jgi:hypothetical protein
MNTPGDKPHNRQVLDHDSFLFRRKKIALPSGERFRGWIARRSVLRAGG